MSQNIKNSSQKYKSIYKGVIIQNDDPLQNGRVKVFVPHIHLSLIGASEELANLDMLFSFFGKNIEEQAAPSNSKIDLTEYIEILKEKLPWAAVLQPIVGETGYAKYNSSTQNSTTSDNNDFNNTSLEASTTQGEGPQALYADDKNVWGDPSYSGGERVDGNSGTYDVKKPYNLPKGTFTVPSVNSQVWVQFVDGDPFTPMVVGAAPTALEWQAHASPSTYPSTYENSSDLSNRNSQENNINDKIKRHQTVQNSGAFTTVTNDTLGKTTRSEIHHSGTSKFIDEAGNESRYKTGDTRDTVVGSTYEDYRQTKNKHVKGNETSITRGNSRVVIGSGNVEAAKKQKDLLGNIHQYKSLFETQRTGADSVFTSPLQTKGGNNSPCPACSKGRSAISLNDSVTENLKQFPKLINDIFVNPLLESISSIIQQLFASFNLTKFLPPILTQFPKPAECSTCGGTGISPSSEEGDFPVEPKKQEIPNLYKEYAGEIAKAEEQLGDGGNHIIEVTKNILITSGTITNDLDSVRVDKKGKAKVAGVKVAEEGTYQAEQESPVVEKVHVDNLAGGTVTIHANNKINLIAGAGGVKFRTLGRVEFGGTMSNLTGEQVNVASENEVNIHGGQRLNLEGKILSLKAGSGEVVMDCNLSINGNANIKGGLSVEGELFVNHITAQMELTPTENSAPSYGQGVEDYPNRKIIGYVDLRVVDGPAEWPVFSMGVDGSKPDKSSMLVYPHSHMTRSVPTKLVGSNKELRSLSSRVSSRMPIAPKGVEMAKKGPLETMFTNYSDEDQVTKNLNPDLGMKEETSTLVKLDPPTPPGGIDAGESVLSALQSAAKSLKIDNLVSLGESKLKQLGLEQIGQHLTQEGFAALGLDKLSSTLGAAEMGAGRISEFIMNKTNASIKGVVQVGMKQLDDFGITSVMNGAKNKQQVINNVNTFVNSKLGKQVIEEYKQLSETKKRIAAAVT